MKAKFCAFLLLFVFLVFSAADPCSPAHAGQQKKLSAPVRLCVYWIPRPRPEAVKSSRQVKLVRGLPDEIERKGSACEQKSARTFFEHLKGQIVTRIGANGKGKRCTLRAILGLIRNLKGSIVYNRQELTGKDPVR